MKNQTNQTNQVEEVEVEEVQVEEVKNETTYNLDELMTTYKTKSSVIRFLSSQGKDRSWISKFMNIRYQHVRNVLTQPLKQVKVEETK